MKDLYKELHILEKCLNQLNELDTITSNTWYIKEAIENLQERISQKKCDHISTRNEIQNTPYGEIEKIICNQCNHIIQIIKE